MVDINHDQYKMLKRINKTEFIDESSLTDEEIKICEFLCEKGFIKQKTIHRYEDSNSIYVVAVPRVESSKYVITQGGKAQISAYKSTFYNIKTSMILSIISTFTAVLALTLQLVQWLQSLTK